MGSEDLNIACVVSAKASAGPVRSSAWTPSAFASEAAACNGPTVRPATTTVAPDLAMARVAHVGVAAIAAHSRVARLAEPTQHPPHARRHAFEQRYRALRGVGDHGLSAR